MLIKNRKNPGDGNLHAHIISGTIPLPHRYQDHTGPYRDHNGVWLAQFQLFIQPRTIFDLLRNED